MRAPDLGYNATLWAMLGPVVMVCFRVRTDAAGQVSATSVLDFDYGIGDIGFDAAFRNKLTKRYGQDVEVTIVVDGGASFEHFQRDRAAGRAPTPPRQPLQPEQKQMDFELSQDEDPETGDDQNTDAGKRFGG